MSDSWIDSVLVCNDLTCGWPQETVLTGDGLTLLDTATESSSLRVWGYWTQVQIPVLAGLLDIALGDSGVASYGALGHVSPSTSSNFISSSLWSKSDSQLPKYRVVCEISWCRCQQLTALSISTALVTKLLVIEQLLHPALKFAVSAPALPLLATNLGDATARICYPRESGDTGLGLRWSLELQLPVRRKLCDSSMEPAQAVWCRLRRKEFEINKLLNKLRQATRIISQIVRKFKNKFGTFSICTVKMHLKTSSDR